MIRSIICRLEDEWNLARKKRASIFDYKIQACDIKQVAANNDFYGHAFVLKKFAWGKDHLDYVIKGSIEHGMFFDDYIWEESEIFNNPFPTILVPRKARIKTFENKTDKKIIPIGPIIAYTDMSVCTESEELKKRLKRTLVVFPSHSSHHVKVNFDEKDFYNEIERVGKEYDTILVCLYWKDILLGRDLAYRSKGWKIVCAGHIFDKLFLYRLRLILELADCVMSNTIGDYIGQAAYLNKPVYLYNQEMWGESMDKNPDSIGSSEVTLLEAVTNNAAYNQLMEGFAKHEDVLTTEQKELCNYYFGLDCVKSRDELLDIFKDMEIRYREMINSSK